MTAIATPVVVPERVPTHWSTTATANTRIRRAAVEAVLLVVLVVGGGLLAWGGGFAHNMVHDQLTSQQIRFPAKGTPALDAKEFPGLQRYAGQLVNSGPKAKAYANEFIGAHLNAVAGGQTYSQVATAAQADPTNAKLTAQKATLFQGETLRGLLLYAWGWSVVGMIASIVSYGAFAGGLVVLLALVFGLRRPQQS